jgi:hypothetical protein
MSAPSVSNVTEADSESLGITAVITLTLDAVMGNEISVYSVVAKRWPRIAAGIVVALGVAEFVVGGLTADSSLQLYVFAWATCTGGLWFLFEKAEQAISDDTRARIAAMLNAPTDSARIRAIPHHFAILFDKIFGLRHWSRRCFYRSCAASIVSSGLVLCLFIALGIGGWSVSTRDDTVGPWIEWRSAESSFGMVFPLFFILALVLNAIPDYLSLLETRWMVRQMEKGRSIVLLLVLDVIATAIIAFVSIWIVLAAGDTARFAAPWKVLTGKSYTSPFFYTAFFTSVWLWLYVASVFVSRALGSMRSGVGVLLSVTDVQKHPLRAMGFVTVMIVSVIFVLLMPLVLI